MMTGFGVQHRSESMFSFGPEWAFTMGRNTHVKAHLPSTTTKALVGIMGGSPSMRLSAELPDGTKLWEDGAKYRASMMKQGQWGAGGGDTAKNVECGLAERGIEALRNAMREARGK
jgi:hypothetical protein